MVQATEIRVCVFATTDSAVFRKIVMDSADTACLLEQFFLINHGWRDSVTRNLSELGPQACTVEYD